MKEIIHYLNESFSFFGVTGDRMALAVLIIIVAIIFKRLFSLWALKYLKRLTSKSETG